jgi:hypothetical protein
VIDAAGAIYVIGGFGFGNGMYQDVWVSTDGGARPDLSDVRACVRGVCSRIFLSRQLSLLS